MSKTVLERFRESFFTIHKNGETMDFTGDPRKELEQFLTQELTSLLAEMEEIIGENENIRFDHFIEEDKVHWSKTFAKNQKNELRAEQRTKLQKLKEKYI